MSFLSVFTNPGVSVANQTVTYSVYSGTLPTGISLAPNGYLVGTATGTSGGSVVIRATDSSGAFSSQTINFSVDYVSGLTVSNISLIENVTIPANTNIYTNAASGTAPITYTTSFSLPTGVTLSSAGVLSGTPTVSGTFSGNVIATDSLGAIETQSITITVAVDTLTFNTNYGGTLPLVQNKPASYSFAATSSYGLTITYSVSAGTLPSGLTLNGTGLLSGTPTNASAFNFTIQAVDSANTITQNISGTTDQVTGLTTTPIILPTGSAITANTHIYATPASGSGSITYSVSGTLPTGITLTGSTGVISGTPIAATGATYSGTLTATDGLGAIETASLTITIDAVYNMVLPTQIVAVNGSPYTAANIYTTAAQSYGSYAITYTASGLPPGMTLSTAGVLSGTPTSSGTYSTTVTATDTKNAIQNGTLNVISDAVTGFTVPSTVSLTQGSTYS